MNITTMKQSHPGDSQQTAQAAAIEMKDTGLYDGARLPCSARMLFTFPCGVEREGQWPLI